MKTKKVMAAILAVLLAAGALTGCGNAEQTNGPKKTRVVLNEVAHSLFYAPMYVAIEEGYFEEEDGLFAGVEGALGVETGALFSIVGFFAIEAVLADCVPLTEVELAFALTNASRNAEPSL